MVTVLKHSCFQPQKVEKLPVDIFNFSCFSSFTPTFLQEQVYLSFIIPRVVIFPPLKSLCTELSSS
jgi:hypothetical protein